MTAENVARPCGCKHSNPFTCAEKRTLDRIPCSCACHISAPPSSKQMDEARAAFSAWLINQHITPHLTAVPDEMLRAYLAGWERAGASVETPAQPRYKVCDRVGVPRRHSSPLAAEVEAVFTKFAYRLREGDGQDHYLDEPYIVELPQKTSAPYSGDLSNWAKCHEHGTTFLIGGKCPQCPENGSAESVQNDS